MKKAKRFFFAVLALVLICLCALSALLCVEDPFFVLSGIEPDEKAVFDNQRYEMAGLIRNQDYSAVIMGTSLAANYRASWFTEGLGEQTLKITFPDGWISEFDTALKLAFASQDELNYVFFSLDPNIIIRSDADRKVELPQYLYDRNPFNDVEYLLNVDTYIRAAESWKQKQSGAGVVLDDAYVWDGAYNFSWSWALAGYGRPQVSETTLPADAYLTTVEENLDVVCRWAEEHPETTFVFWFPPYSILQWDKTIREGRLDAVFSALDYASQRLCGYNNVELHCFLDDYDTILDLNNYTDHVHCSGTVTHNTALRLMGEGRQLTEANYKEILDEFKAFVAVYDYEALFPAKK